MKRVFSIDIETCPACGGGVRIIACIEQPAVIEKIFIHLYAKTTVLEVVRQPRFRALPSPGIVRLSRIFQR